MVYAGVSQLATSQVLSRHASEILHDKKTNIVESLAQKSVDHATMLCF
jgi:hypothetical protein